MFQNVFLPEPLENKSISSLVDEIQELEDTYADCLKDEVEVSTLNFLWSKIKSLKEELAKRK